MLSASMNNAMTDVAIVTFGAPIRLALQYVHMRTTGHQGVSTESYAGSILRSRDTG